MADTMTAQEWEAKFMAELGKPGDVDHNLAGYTDMAVSNALKRMGK